MQIALDNYHSMSAKTRAAGMFACTSQSCSDKCASTKVVKIAQIETRAQACLSMTEMQAMTRSVKTMQGECRTTELALPLLMLDDRTLVHQCEVLPEIVAVSRCSILTPAGPD